MENLYFIGNLYSSGFPEQNTILEATKFIEPKISLKNMEMFFDILASMAFDSTRELKK